MNPYEDLVQTIRLIWDQCRTRAARTVNSELVTAYWQIGRTIVEAEQGGNIRAEYGDKVLEKISQSLKQDFGDGFSVSSLRYMRLFYTAYPELLQIHHALRDELYQTETETWKPGILNSALSWTQYRCLLKVEDRSARDFYERETITQGWSSRVLERQISTQLFYRLAKSRDKDGLIQLAMQGQTIEKPIDAIKDPYVLEFLSIPETHQLSETDLEQALLDRLQDFLLELGKGFAFIGRQKRISLDGDHFYPDLVFYHARLKCYVIVDLKVDKLSHGDLGQMQLYVHYYDREVRDESDNPTIGIVLCTDKNDLMVKYILDETQPQIFASRYQLYMPSETQLVEEIRKELNDLNIDSRT